MQIGIQQLQQPLLPLVWEICAGGESLHDCRGWLKSHEDVAPLVVNLFNSGENGSIHRLIFEGRLAGQHDVQRARCIQLHSSKKSIGLVALMVLSSIGGILLAPNASASVSGDYEITNSISPRPDIYMTAWDP